MATPQEVDDKVLNLLGNNSVFWSVEERSSSFDEALSVWNGMTGEWSGKVSTIPSGEIIQDVPKQVISIQRVSHNGLILDPTSVEELDLGSPGWDTRTNLALNGSFEDWTAGAPDNWDTVLFGGQFSQETSAENVIFGASSFKIGPLDSSHAFQQITTTIGSSYLVEFWAKRDPRYPGIPFVSLSNSLNPNQQVISIPNTEFQKFSIKFTSSVLGILEINLVSSEGQEGVLIVDGFMVSGGETPRVWAPVGFNKVILYPTPTDGIVTYEGIVDPPFLPQATVQFGDDKLDVLTSYAHHVLTFKEAGQEFAATGKAMERMVQEAGKRNQELRATALYREYMGEIRDDAQRPRATGEQTIGGR